MRRSSSMVTGLAAIAIIVSACGGASLPTPSRSSAAATPTPTARPAATATARLTRDADLDLLVDRLRAVHPNPFLEEGEAAFLARVDAIKATTATMTDAEFLVAVMRLMGARERDGHSGAWAMAQPGRLMHALPIWLWDFPDGLRIVAAMPGHKDLVGARVVRVGHATLEEARRAVEPLVPRDNASNLRGNLPIYLILREVTETLGLVGPGESAMTVELLDGTTREIDAEPVPMPELRDWIFDLYGGRYPSALPPSPDADPNAPLYRRDQDRHFWTEPLDDAGGRYVAYNEVAMSDGGGLTISELARTISDAIPTSATARLVVDLRNNGGGDNTTYGPLRRAIEATAEARPGHVALIAGRGTFSAAGNFITQLKVGPQGDAIVLVGEPPGGGLDMYGDVAVVELPASGITVLISGSEHVMAPGDDRLQIEPDVSVEVSWTDFATGRDPVLDAALRATGGRD